jgi:hypothetical protein
MKTIAALVIVASISIPGPCQTIASTTPQYHRSELKRMIRTAHTPEDCEKLSVYFQAKEQEFRKKAEDEKKELDRRLAMPYASSKYPTAVDSARGLLQYYQVKAADFAQRTKYYQLRATMQG